MSRYTVGYNPRLSVQSDKTPGYVILDNETYSLDIESHPVEILFVRPGQNCGKTDAQAAYIREMISNPNVTIERKDDMKNAARSILGAGLAMAGLGMAADHTAGLARTLSHAIMPADPYRQDAPRRKDKAKRDRALVHMRNYRANRKRRSCKLGRHLRRNFQRGLMGRA